MADYDAVLLLGFGGPERFEDVRPFVLNVVKGRPVPPERVDEVVEQYRAIGGRSPFRELTERQAQALRSRLAASGERLPVYVGMLYGSPCIKDTIGRMQSAGVKHAVGIVLAPHRVEASFQRYVRAVDEAVQSLPAKRLRVDFVDPWHAHPLFIEALSDRLAEALARLPDSAREKARVIFTAHSVPVAMPDAPSYARQIAETAELVARRLRLDDWLVSYQSRSGTQAQPWLEPDVRDALKTAALDGVGHVVVAPVGFVCDHVEVLFDLDMQAAAVARKAGLNMVRAYTVGDHPAFIELLQQLVGSRSGSGRAV